MKKMYNVSLKKFNVTPIKKENKKRELKTNNNRLPKRTKSTLDNNNSIQLQTARPLPHKMIAMFHLESQTHPHSIKTKLKSLLLRRSMCIPVPLFLMRLSRSSNKVQIKRRKKPTTRMISAKLCTQAQAASTMKT